VVGPPSPIPAPQGKWTLSGPARVVVTRLVLLGLTMISIDGALTWYVTDDAANTVAAIELRDGVVATDDTDLGLVQAAEIERAVGDRSGRIRLGALKWIPATLLAALAGLFVSRADPDLRRSLVMAVALTLAIWLVPRVLYSHELSILEAVLG
jgi:hypothetical protein